MRVLLDENLDRRLKKTFDEELEVLTPLSGHSNRRFAIYRFIYYLPIGAASKAVESIKPVLPLVLLIDGHNPLTLLHSALSEGLHEKTEEQCLELATSIRVVLTELSERISTALKDEAKLKHALNILMNKRSLQADGK